MTKEEKIKEAYGEHWRKAQHYVDEYGWIRWDKLWAIGMFKESQLEWKDISKFYRPIMLQGIENNNGWSVLNEESYENLENDYYMWYNNENGDWEIDDLSVTHLKNYTHFQKIQVPPKPPIY